MPRFTKHPLPYLAFFFFGGLFVLSMALPLHDNHVNAAVWGIVTALILLGLRATARADRTAEDGPTPQQAVEAKFRAEAKLLRLDPANCELYVINHTLDWLKSERRHRGEV